jgi:hypothetical protein
MIEQWEKVRTPPKDALKKITGGRLNGMTDIKPQWRVQVMTEVYGLCGVGWRYEITRKEIFDGSDGQSVAVVDIDLYVKSGDEWSYAIPGTGGSMLVEKERAGLHTNDECSKMALTDALSVAMTKIGVASDIYMGLWDGSKYKDADVTVKQPPKEDVPDFDEKGAIKTLKGTLNSKMGSLPASEKKDFYQYATQGKETVDLLNHIISDFDGFFDAWKKQRDDAA